MLLVITWICLFFSYALGNTEKVIFLGPPPVDPAFAYPSADYTHLPALDPGNNLIRVYLEAEPPVRISKGGKPSWFILRNLTESQRYEVRICWAATQPTTFKLEVHELETLARVPELLSELSEYALSLHRDVPDGTVSSQGMMGGEKQPIMFLRILTVADFYTQNRTLMSNAPPALVDIIMDPFILNVLPQSLVPTVAYISAVATASWFAGNLVSSWICIFTEPGSKRKVP
ncbi:hypothetical protein F5Y17DRAFT_355068 [Xylariaceae sp. FL0594]|nr:hypothetical protein F5Y17DRAFT_355068 [Xylariaceae sp. FL0594]